MFAAVSHETELEKIAGLLDSAKAYIVVAIYLGGVALFDLFEVTQAMPGAACADGEGAVGKVDEEFASMQVVGRDG